MRCPLLLLVALVAGCGFLPEDNFTGKRAGDGIAPWTDLGPVQVCFGNQYLSPPDGEPGSAGLASAGAAPQTSSMMRSAAFSAAAAGK